MQTKKLKNLNPFEQEKVIDDGKEVFIITRYFIGSRNLDKVFEEILQKHDELKDKVS
ncbi:hypothetical protein Q428_14035 [Fervidicella metallireducens AeB]|uniref:Uncharacterized protein n=1 Tax=Fervidicella metallireducens AeB TaxID=1403537 RepID=A0A017RTR5_9CLOT|nr:hypothetical protein [Fervidicella metallireducens]EYE87300.1 hypothetical protein Q428_14035 [Fervidicella metallireducens AeB]